MEYKKKCNVCGKIFCYTDEDLKKNAENVGLGLLSSIGGLASALGGGTIFHTQHLKQQSDRYSDKIVDFDQCPYCHSRDLSFYTGETKPSSPVYNVASAKTININSTAPTESLLKRVFMFLEDGDWVSADAYCEACLDRDPELAEAYLGKLMAELHVRTPDQLKDQAKPFENRRNYQKALRFANDGLRGSLINYIEHINNRNEKARLTEIYNRAKSTMSVANTEQSYKEAANLFRGIVEYKDSAILAKECSDKAEKARLAEIYNHAKSTMSIANTEQSYKEAANLFKKIVEYKDSAILAKACLDKAEDARKDAILSEAASQMIGNVISNYESAIKLCESISGWKNADEKIHICKERIAEIKAKEEQDRKEAEKIAKRHKRFVITMVALSPVIIALIIVFITVIIPNYIYDEAIALMHEGDVIGAYESFSVLKDYKDSEKKAKSIYSEYLTEKSKHTNVYITFGKYEQDNNIDNGSEDIEWLVLDVKDNKVLVISKYGLDCQPYNTRYASVAWKNCTLRKWLNDDFLNIAFDDIERSRILTVTVTDDNNTNSSTESNNATLDKVFLFNGSEVEKYCTVPRQRICKATDYAVANGARVSEKYGNCYWMIRLVTHSIATDRLYVHGINATGDRGALSDVDENYGAVRPALWIELDA